MKVVINKCWGGFSLSEEACRILNLEHPHASIERDDPKLVEVVENLGEKSWGAHARLCVVEIPDGIEWQIEDYDGVEHVAESHRTWS